MSDESVKRPPLGDVDDQGNCKQCGGVHFGTGRICVYSPDYNPRPVEASAPPWKHMNTWLEAPKPKFRTGGPMQDDEVIQAAQNLLSTLIQTCDGVDPADADEAAEIERVLVLNIAQIRDKARREAHPEEEFLAAAIEEAVRKCGHPVGCVQRACNHSVDCKCSLYCRWCYELDRLQPREQDIEEAERIVDRMTCLYCHEGVPRSAEMVHSDDGELYKPCDAMGRAIVAALVAEGWGKK